MKGQGDGRAGDRLRGVESKGQTDQTKSGLKDAGEKIKDQVPRSKTLHEPLAISDGASLP